MRIENVRALPGPNIFIHRPVLKARFHLEDLTEKESTDFPGFVDRLLCCLPDLHDHHCAKGEPGGFIERLHEGTYFGHIVEHVALELQNAVGLDAHFGRTVYADAPGRYDVIIEYKNEPVARFLLQVALEFVQALVKAEAYPLEEKLAEARQLLVDTKLGPSTAAIVEAAERRGIPWIRLTEGSLVQLGYGVQRQLIQATETSRTSSIAVTTACNKELTKTLLEQASIPVPHGIIARTPEEAIAALKTLEPPLAVKPLDGNQGKGISLRLNTPSEVAAAFARAAKISPDVIVEEFFAGCDYRLLMVDGKLFAASQRMPAHVIGDGVHSLAQLIEQENRNPLRGDGHEQPLTKIHIDDTVRELVGRPLDFVPEKGQRVFLRLTANLSTGGTACDVTDDVHPDIARLCERAARVVGLDICGVDLITPDIREPLPEQGAGIVEVNASPGIRMHQYPSTGKKRDVGQAIIDHLYPNESNGRIPTLAVTGTNGKTTVARLVAHGLSSTGKVVGLTTTDGIYIGGHCVARGDLTGFNSARTVLSDPLVEVAVLETARGGIVRRSLGYDWTDAAILTNIQLDHLGQDGIETIDDLLFVKSLVAERVRAGGTLILNADDERLAHLPAIPRVRKLPRRIVYFSTVDDNPVVRQHLAHGGAAFFLRNGWLVEAVGQGAEDRLMRENDLPMTLGGAARFQTSNILAAIAGCRTLGLSQRNVLSLTDFQSVQNNSGRMNLYRCRHGHVIMDYAHNPGAFKAIESLTTAWPDRCWTGIVTAPGDRTDNVIEELGQLTAQCFDRVIIREDEDLRGRQPGEIARLLLQAVQDADPDLPCRIIRDESIALKTALEEMEEGEIVTLFYEKNTEPCVDILKQFGAVPVSTIEPVQTMQTVSL